MASVNADVIKLLTCLCGWGKCRGRLHLEVVELAALKFCQQIFLSLLDSLLNVLLAHSVVGFCRARHQINEVSSASLLPAA